jgi:hypothetical protein
VASDVRDEIGYGRLVQEALRGVARGALQHAAREGLPGEHHFYVTFRTGAAGVALPARLAAQFPDEMTVILQHQFWNLEVDERAFSVTLRFGGQPERLTVPFEALTAFVDPSVEFGLRFVSGDEPAEEARPAADTRAPASEAMAPGPGQDKVVDLAAFKKPRRRRRSTD